MNSARLIAMLQYSGEQNIRFDCNYITLDLYNTAQYKLHTKKNHTQALLQPRTQGTFRNESTLVDRGHVVSLYCPDFGQ